MRSRSFVPSYLGLIAGCALLLAACGNKGQLTLPPPATAAQPATPKPAPATPPAKPADHNSVPSTAKP